MMPIQYHDLGVTEYAYALRVQRYWHAWCREEQANILLLTQHRPVITLGYRYAQGQQHPREQLLLSREELRKRGIRVELADRGGGATYHGPGQLVVYPLFSTILRKYGVRRFITQLEDVMLQTCLHVGVFAHRKVGQPGVWLGEKKIGAVGIAVRQKVTLHGFCLNVDLDLLPFTYIVPCGLAGMGVTSLKEEGGRPISFPDVVQALIREISRIFAVRMEEFPHERCLE